MSFARIRKIYEKKILSTDRDFFLRIKKLNENIN